MCEIPLKSLLPTRHSDLTHSVTEGAIDRVDEAADPEWKVGAEYCLLLVCERLSIFTADDVWEELDAAGIEWPHEPSALGPIMRTGKANGWANSTNYTRECKRPKAHRKPQRVWESLVFKGGTAVGGV